MFTLEGINTNLMMTATFEWKLKAMRRQDSTLMKFPPARRWSSDELVSSLIYTVLPLAILLLCLPSFAACCGDTWLGRRSSHLPCVIDRSPQAHFKSLCMQYILQYF
jgi:hypothetical protein